MVLALAARAAPVAIPAARAVSAWASRAAPEVVDVVAREVTKRSGVVVRGLKQLLAFANSSPVKASLVVAAAGAMGHDLYDAVKDLVTARSSDDADGVYESEVAGLVDKNAHLELSLGAPDDVRLAQDLVVYFRNQFGVRSPDELSRLHLMIRAFSEMSTAQVDYISRVFWNGGRIR